MIGVMKTKLVPQTNHANPQSTASDPIGMWSSPALISENNFVYKSLSNWALNTAVGCDHGCLFCFLLLLIPGLFNCMLYINGNSY